MLSFMSYALVEPGHSEDQRRRLESSRLITIVEPTDIVVSPLVVHGVYGLAHNRTSAVGIDQLERPLMAPSPRDRVMRLVRSAAKTLFSVLDLLLGSYPGPRIMIYHQIGAGHGEELDVPRAVFLQHLDWIERSCGVVRPLAEALDRRLWDDPRRLFVLTFDDGYEDMYTGAFPILQEREIPFTLYLTTHPTESGRPLAPERRSTPLTWDHVREMRATGLMTLGAHTHTHPDLRRLDAEAIASELETSDRLIEERAGVQPTHFAYPWGYWSAAADPLVRERYSSAVLGGGVRMNGVEDSHLLHRIPIQLSDGVVFFRHKMKRGQRTEEFARRLLAGYRGP